jgi:flagellin-like protein
MMMKKSWKNHSAVSPVFAAILMVAITVVLAAVLYVTAMRIGPTPGDSAPVMSAQKDTILDRVVLCVSSPTRSDMIEFNAGGTNILCSAVTSSVTANGLTFTFVDAGHDNKVTTGDYIEVTGTKTNPNANVTINILWIGGEVITNLVSTIW